MPSNEDITRQGKALAAAIRGLQALDSAGVEISATEHNLRAQLIRDYQRRLRAIIADAPPEAVAEILPAGLPDLPLPVHDPGVN